MGHKVSFFDGDMWWGPTRWALGGPPILKIPSGVSLYTSHYQVEGVPNYPTPPTPITRIPHWCCGENERGREKESKERDDLLVVEDWVSCPATKRGCLVPIAFKI